MIDNVIEFLMVWLFSPYLYVGYIIHWWPDIMPSYLLLFAIAAVAILVARRLQRRAWTRPILLVTVMPGTIICGSAATMPWAYSMVYAMGDTGCATYMSQAACLALNAAVLYGVPALWRLVRRSSSDS